MVYDRIMTHTFEVAIVDSKGNMRYTKSFKSFKDAKTLFDEFPIALYDDEKVIIIPHRDK